MTEQKCKCGKPMTGTTICIRGDKSCKHTLDVALANVSTYYDELDTVRSRQTKYGDVASKGSIGKTRPIGMDLAFDLEGVATRAQTATRATVVKWGRRAIDEWPAPLTGAACRITVDKKGKVHECRHKSCADIRARKHPDDTVRSVLRYLQRNLNRIVTAPWAGGLLTELLACERSLSRIVDRPTEGWYAGLCGHTIEPDRPHDGFTCACTCHTGTGCDIDCNPDIRTFPGITCTRVLYAAPDKPFVTCPNCNTRHAVKDRRDQLILEAEDRNATVRILARIITTLGASDASEARLEGRINLWVHRGKLRSLGVRVVDGKERPVYRVGDVLDLLAQDHATRSAS